MKKKLLAVAVAGALAAPVVAFAQTTVTISGKAAASFGSYAVSQRTAAGVGHSSEFVVRDESSRIVFEIREDIGKGLAAIGKFDLRFAVPDAGLGGNTGESFVGIHSAEMGRFTFGKFDLHYGKHQSTSGSVHGSLLGNPIAVFDTINGGATAIANQTRTQNVIHYRSPKIAGMLDIDLAYSTNPTAASNNLALTGTAGQEASATNLLNQAESDLRHTSRKGSAWNFNPKLSGKNWEASYSYWTAEPDRPITLILASDGLATAATTVTRQRGDTVSGYYQWGGLRAGMAYNKSALHTTTIATDATVKTSERTAWGIPVAYNFGQHTVFLDYYRAGNDKVLGTGTKSRLVGVSYGYDLSKRTTVGVNYAKIANDSAAIYNLFTATTGGHGALSGGEDPSFLGLTVNHRF